MGRCTTEGASWDLDNNCCSPTLHSPLLLPRLGPACSFLEWRRSLSELQDNEDLLLTPFERNLDFWRQLWRVIERRCVMRASARRAQRLQYIRAPQLTLYNCRFHTSAFPVMWWCKLWTRGTHFSSVVRMLKNTSRK